MRKVVTMSTKGQLVLPKEFRERFGFRPGARVAFREENGKLVLEKPATDIIAELEAFAKKYGRKKPYASKEYEDAMERGDY